MTADLGATCYKLDAAPSPGGANDSAASRQRMEGNCLARRPMAWW